MLICLDDVMCVGTSRRAVEKALRRLREELARRGFALKVSKCSSAASTTLHWVGKVWSQLLVAPGIFHLSIRPYPLLIEELRDALPATGALCLPSDLDSLLGKLLWAASPSLLAASFFQPIRSALDSSPGNAPVVFTSVMRDLALEGLQVSTRNLCMIASPRPDGISSLILKLSSLDLHGKLSFTDLCLTYVDYAEATGIAAVVVISQGSVFVYQYRPTSSTKLCAWSTVG